MEATTRDAKGASRDAHFIPTSDESTRPQVGIDFTERATDFTERAIDFTERAIDFSARTTHVGELVTRFSEVASRFGELGDHHEMVRTQQVGFPWRNGAQTTPKGGLPGLTVARLGYIITGRYNFGGSHGQDSDRPRTRRARAKG